MKRLAAIAATRPARWLVLSCLAPWLALAVEGGGREVSTRLKQLSLEQLMNTEVTLLSKKPEKLAELPAAVYVIHGDEIRRSGATSIADALRLAPGVQVARIDSNQWAIGIRGFASRLSRSMLALMDGRTLYTPLFAGVYWEAQDALLEDIDRIEVIRGPGGTLWGANAVNGVVNVISKPAKDTQGVYLEGGGGSLERDFGAVRYGGSIGGSTHYRVYGQYFDRDAGFSAESPNFDAWHMGRAGFRGDTGLSGGDSLTVQGDAYQAAGGQRMILSHLAPPFQEEVRRDSDFSGGNLLGRWRHATGDTSELTLQAYYDQTFRRDPNFREQRDTFDFDLQHRFRPFSPHEVVWGLAYRLSTDRTRGIDTIRFEPASRNLNLVSGFVQDEIALLDGAVRVTLGTKLEHNDYTGAEVQPSGRILWTPAPWHHLWASVTRAVRTPSRVERDVAAEVLLDPQAPTFFRLIGDGGFRSEKTVAYEAGYRIQPIAELFLDAAVFYNRSTDLLSLEPGTPFAESNPPPDRLVAPFFIRNGLDADTYGIELSADAHVTDWWRIGGSYSYLDIHLQRASGSRDSRPLSDTEGASPHHQAVLRSSMELSRKTQLDAWLRYVDSLPAPSQRIGSYVSLDLRLAWAATDHLELSAVGQNLLAPHHAEFNATPGPVEVPRGAYGRLAWRW